MRFESCRLEGREFIIDNLPVRINLIIEMILVDRPRAMVAGLPFPGSLISNFLWGGVGRVDGGSDLSRLGCEVWGLGCGVWDVGFGVSKRIGIAVCSGRSRGHSQERARSLETDRGICQQSKRGCATPPLEGLCGDW